MGAIEDEQPHENLSGDPDDPAERYLAFAVGPDHFALPLVQVHSVLRPVPVTPVPFTPDCLLGVISLRGQIVPLLDLRSCLGEGDTPRGEDSRFLVVEADGCLRALVVHRLQEVLRAGLDEQVPDLEHPTGERPACVERLLRVDGRLYSVLDPARLEIYFSG